MFLVVKLWFAIFSSILSILTIKCSVKKHSGILGSTLGCWLGTLLGVFSLLLKLNIIDQGSIAKSWLSLIQKFKFEKGAPFLKIHIQLVSRARTRNAREWRTKLQVTNLASFGANNSRRRVWDFPNTFGFRPQESLTAKSSSWCLDQKRSSHLPQVFENYWWSKRKPLVPPLCP